MSPGCFPDVEFCYAMYAGDTFEGLAQLYGMSTAALMALNPGISAASLFAGQVLKTCADSPCQHTIRQVGG